MGFWGAIHISFIFGGKCLHSICSFVNTALEAAPKHLNFNFQVDRVDLHCFNKLKKKKKERNTFYIRFVHAIIHILHAIMYIV